MSFRPYPKSLAGQLLLLVLVALVLAQIATVFVFAESRRSAVRAAAREQVLGRTAALVRLIEDTPEALHPRILRAAGGGRTVFRIDADPIVAPQDDPPFAAATLAEAFGEDRDVRVALIGRPRVFGDRGDRGERGEHGEDYRRRDGGGEGPSEPRGGDRPAFVPVVAMSAKLAGGSWLNAETVLPDPSLLAWPSIVSTLMIGAALVVVVVASVRRITRPLRNLATAADRFGRGETVPPLPAEGPEEVRRTIAAFNAMQGRVGRFVADRTRMLAAISHDLRTPLTALRLRAEFVDDDDVRDKIVDTVDEMSRMTEAALTFARDDASGEDARLTDVSALVRAVSDDFADLGSDVTVDGPDRLEHVVRPMALRRAVRNLVENALRYGERARVSLSETSQDISIVVDDDGPGIPEDKLSDVFEPFVRLETSRSAETGGVGLGLSTVRTIARAHGGDVTLENRAGGGLRATIRLPRGG